MQRIMATKEELGGPQRMVPDYDAAQSKYLDLNLRDCLQVQVQPFRDAPAFNDEDNNNNKNSSRSGDKNNDNDNSKGGSSDAMGNETCSKTAPNATLTSNESANPDNHSEQQTGETNLAETLAKGLVGESQGATAPATTRGAPLPPAASSSSSSSSSSLCSSSRLGVEEEVPESSGLDREVRRLKVLKSYLGVLDCDHGNKFERLTTLASRIFRVPMALVTVADLDKQYLISCRGLDSTATARKSTFCSHAVSTDSDILVVNDATKNNLFATDPHVTGFPNVRFYAGAPLICPEGYRLGTLCVMDTKPRAEEMSLEDKQCLMELAAMAMETLVDLRDKKQFALRDPSQQIACTAHDLLTPLTGIALSLSLLKQDESLQRKLSDQQRDMIETAEKCSTVMNSICHKTMNFFRDQDRPRGPFDHQSQSSQQRASSSSSSNKKGGPSTVTVADLVKNLNIVIEPFPKKVPIIFSVDPNVPLEFISDDMKIFRSAANFLTNACAKTETGSIHFRIYKSRNVEKQTELVFECEDTGPGIDVAKYAYLFKPVREEADPLRVSKSISVINDVPPGGCRAGVQNTGLGLYSVATQISSIGGKYGFRPRGLNDTKVPSGRSTKVTGSIFWFSIPCIVPSKPPVESSENSDGKTTGTSSNVPFADGISKLSRQRQQSSSDATVSMTNQSTNKESLARRAKLLLNGRQSHRNNKGSSRPSSNQGSSSGGLKRKLSSDDVLEVYSAKAKNSLTMNVANATMTVSRKQQALVIEDSLVLRKSLARALSRLGFEVTLAVNGMEGLKELKLSLFDIVLCDFLMPVMDGLDCVQQYRHWESLNRPFFHQYIVGISAHANEKDVEQGYKVGMNDFRSKPVTYDQLTDLKNGKEFCLKSQELDKLGHEIECLKRRKLQPNKDIDNNNGGGGSSSNNNRNNGKSGVATGNGRGASSSSSSLSSPSSSVNSSNQKVCLVIEGPNSSVISKLAKLASEKIGWKIVVTGPTSTTATSSTTTTSSATSAVGDDDDGLHHTYHHHHHLRGRIGEESALGLLKIRNWDAVFVDDDIGSSRCLALFREWEKTHRVNRQKNVILISASFITPQQNKGSTSFQVPTGFDGALGKPIELGSIKSFLEKVSTSCDIVTR